MTLDEALGHAKLVAYAAYFVLKQPLQRLAELQMHLLRQSANVVMALDNHTCYAQTFNAVGIDCALCKPLGISNLLCLGIEHLNKVAAYNLALLLRVGNAFKVFEELLACINADNVESESLICLHNLLELILAQHSVVNEDTCKVLSRWHG